MIIYLLSRFLSAFQILCIAVLVVDTLIAMYFLTSTTIITSSLQNYYAYAHLSIDNNRTQQWISQRDGIKILFTYEPEKPIIDAFTELKFSVLNLTSGEHLKDFMARVVVTNGQRLFKFENITVADGDFSVKYIFPDDGTHQVVTRISKETSILTLAAFNVFVPHQSSPSILNPFPASSTVGSEDSRGLISRIIVVIMLPVAITVVVVFMLRRGRRSKRKRKDNA
jgi:hypothetical protein